MPSMRNKGGVPVLTLGVLEDIVPTRESACYITPVRPAHFGTGHATTAYMRVGGSIRKPSHRSCNSVASPARNSSVPDCEARLTAQEPGCGSALLSAAVSTDVGTRSVLFSRINVFGVTSGASSAGISNWGPEGVTETASGNESTKIEASAT